MAALREFPFGLYYGSVDATPLFVMLAGLYTEHTGDVETLRELWPNIEAALDWIDGLGDPDRDGFVEYHRANQQGLVNQGWKDFTTLSSTPTAQSPKARSRSAKCRATSTRRNAWRRGARTGSASIRSATRSIPRPLASPNGLRRRFGAMTLALMRSPSTGKSGNVGCGPPTLGRYCSAASPRRSERKP